MSLTMADIEILSRALLDLYALDDASTFALGLVAMLKAVVSGNACGYTEVNSATGRVFTVVDPQGTIDEIPPELLARHHSEHPVLHHYEQTSERRALAISDFISDAEFERRAIYS